MAARRKRPAGKRKQPRDPPPSSSPWVNAARAFVESHPHRAGAFRFRGNSVQIRLSGAIAFLRWIVETEQPDIDSDRCLLGAELLAHRQQRRYGDS